MAGEPIFKLGPRQTARENATDVLKALGVVLVLASASVTNGVMLLLAILLSFILPGGAEFFLPSVSLSDLPSLVQYFLSTLPLLIATTLYTLILFADLKGLASQSQSEKSLGFGGHMMLFLIIFGLSLAFGDLIGGVRFDDPSLHLLLPLNSFLGPFPVVKVIDYAIAICISFGAAYGAYRFFTTVLAGIVLAWILSFKIRTQQPPTQR